MEAGTQALARPLASPSDVPRHSPQKSTEVNAFTATGNFLSKVEDVETGANS